MAFNAESEGVKSFSFFRARCLHLVWVPIKSTADVVPVSLCLCISSCLSLPLCDRIFTAIMPMVAAGLIPDDPTLQPIRRLMSLVWLYIWLASESVPSFSACADFLSLLLVAFWLADCGAVSLSLYTDHNKNQPVRIVVLSFPSLSTVTAHCPLPLCAELTTVLWILHTKALFVDSPEQKRRHV